MYLFTHALHNIWRNRGRNFLIGAIMLAIITTTVITLAINNTSSALIENYTELFSSQVQITPDMEKLREQALSENTGGPMRIRRPELDPELALNFTESEYLKESIITGSMNASSEDLVAIDASETTDTGTIPSTTPNGSMSLVMSNGGDFKILGDDYTAFTDGNRTLSDDGVSAYPENANEALISVELANANNLNVGDTFTTLVSFSQAIPADIDTTILSDGDQLIIADSIYKVTTDSRTLEVRATRDVEITFLIAGLYDDLRDAYEDANMPALATLNNRNEIITPLVSLLDVRDNNETGLNISAEYYLQNPDDLVLFEAQARELGLPDTFLITTDSTMYNQLVTPLSGIKNISLTFLIVVLVLGSIIMLFLASISIRERKYEIGVLRAMGMKKVKVAFSLWLELLVVTAISLVIGLGIGALSAQPVSTLLLASQATTTSQPPTGGPTLTAGGDRPVTNMPSGGMVISGQNQNNQQIKTIDVQLDVLTTVQIILIALGLSSLAGLLAVKQITKYEPLKILAERN